MDEEWGMLMLRNVKIQNQVMVYLVFVFIASWAAVLMIAGIDGILSKSVPIALLGVAMLIGTGLGGVVLIGLFDGIDGFKRVLRELLKWNVGLKWWLLALLTVPGAIAASVAIMSPFLSNPLPALMASESKSALVLSALAGAIFIALFEEIGWTGFLIPKMRKTMSLFGTGVTVGFIWGLWHLILFVETDTFTTVMGMVLLLVRLFTTLPVVRLLMVVIYDKTKSFLVTLFVHISFVFSMMLFEPVLTNSEMMIYILVRTILLLVVASAVMKKSTVLEQGVETMKA